MGLCGAVVKVADLMDCEAGPGFHVMTDKGTLDAIGLSGRSDARWIVHRTERCVLWSSQDVARGAYSQDACKRLSMSA